MHKKSIVFTALSTIFAQVVVIYYTLLVAVCAGPDLRVCRLWTNVYAPRGRGSPMDRVLDLGSEGPGFDTRCQIKTHQVH